MEPLIHFIVPFTALTLAGVRLRKALSISLLALLPDLDALFLVHRSLSHSLIVLLVVAVPLLALAHKLRLYSYVWLESLAVASHLIVDLFSGYTPLLWPLYGYSLRIQVGLMAHIGSSPSLSPTVGFLTRPITFQPFQSLDALLLTGEGLILSAILLMPVLLKAFRQARKLALD